MPKRLFLVDGHAQTYRAFYAVEGLRAPDGRPTGAVYGFTRMLMDTIRRHRPDYLAVAFDAPGPTFRHEAYADYKATRKPTPSELTAQVPLIHQIVEAFGIPIYMIDNYEADDVIGTLARKALDQGLDQVVLVSADKDLAQLLAGRVCIYDPRKDEFTTADEYEKKKAFPPHLLPDVMGLVGDSSDNIPGVPGIGHKGAAQLIGRYGSLDALLEHKDEVKGKRGESLRQHADQARLSRDLATIDRQVPVDLDLDACRHTTPHEAQLFSLYDDLGFQTLKKTLSDATLQRNAVDTDYRLVNTEDAYQDFRAQLGKVGHLAFDVETTDTDPMRAQLVGMSFSWEPHTGWYLPLRAPEGERVLGEQVLRDLAQVLADPAVEKTGHNLKYDFLVMQRLNVRLEGVKFDSMLASHLIAGHLREHSLDAAAARLLQIETTHIEEIIGKGRNQITMDQAPLDQVCPYAAEDADVALRLEEVLSARLQERGLEPLLYEIELPLSRVLADMQARGVRIDVDQLAAISRDMESQLEEITGRIHELAGRPFNIASPRQLAEILFDELAFPVIRRTKTARSTDEAVLRELLLVEHEKRALPQLLLRYRALSKLKGTYLDALPQMVNPETGRIHTTFHQTGTATGRLSSSDPNLQNIPIRTEEGRGIRAAFVPEPGWKLLSADYSQVELRILAHLSEDEALRRAFREGRDIHTVVAAQVFDAQEDAVTAQQRQAAKAVNFGIVYGQSAFGLSQATGMPRSEAQAFIDRYFETYPGVAAWVRETIHQARAQGGVRTLLGRPREITEIASQNKTRRTQGERMAVNTVVQGSAADLMKRAMIDLHRRLDEDGLRSRMVLQIHDELVLECPADEVDAVRVLVREAMEGAMDLSVPLVVDIGVGDNWREVK